MLEKKLSLDVEELADVNPFQIDDQFFNHNSINITD